MGEAIKMTIEDINLDDAILTVRETKFFKSRLVPVGRDVAGILRLYRKRQWKARAATQLTRKELRQANDSREFASQSEMRSLW